MDKKGCRQGVRHTDGVLSVLAVVEIEEGTEKGYRPVLVFYIATAKDKGAEGAISFRDSHKKKVQSVRGGLKVLRTVWRGLFIILAVRGFVASGVVFLRGTNLKNDISWADVVAESAVGGRTVDYHMATHGPPYFLKRYGQTA